MTSLRRDFYTFTAHQRPTVGDTKTSVIDNDHMGWLKCDGRQLNKDQFYFLFRVIGYKFGGSGNSFNLPNPAGRVPGIVGTGWDRTAHPLSTFTFELGSNYGEYEHQLTIPELASHNHGVAPTTQNAANNRTSEYTHSHRADGGAAAGGTTSNAGEHNHTGTTDPAGWARGSAGVTGVQTTDVADDTGTHTHTFTTSSNGDHNHGITADTHYHIINSAGNDVPHNTIQPTIAIGNMFIYSGKPNYPGYDNPTPWAGFPYQTGTNIY